VSFERAFYSFHPDGLSPFVALHDVEHVAELSRTSRNRWPRELWRPGIEAHAGHFTDKSPDQARYRRS